MPFGSKRLFYGVGGLNLSIKGAGPGNSVKGRLLVVAVSDSIPVKSKGLFRIPVPV